MHDLFSIFWKSVLYKKWKSTLCIFYFCLQGYTFNVTVKKIVWINCNIISTIVYYITYYNLFTAYILYICLVLFYMLAWLFSLEKSLVPNTTFAYIIWFFSCSNSEMKGRVPSFYRFCNKTTEMKDADPDNAHQFHSTPVCFPYYLIFEFDFISLNSAWAICWKSH